jgi:hypothetical protein
MTEKTLKPVVQVDPTLDAQLEIERAALAELERLLKEQREKIKQMKERLK